VWDKAVVYLRQAGDKAPARSANREAVACFEQALVALVSLPEGRERHEQAIDVRLGTGSPLKQLFSAFITDFAAWLLQADMRDAYPLNIELLAETLAADQIFHVLR
jgi:predicted ATPase